MFVDIYSESLNRRGEELCGDVVRAARQADRSIVVLSSGFDGGVKACIVATLTAEIIVTMFRMDIPIEDVVATVIGTLPPSKTHGAAYSTFTVLEVHHENHAFRVMNYDNPETFFFRDGAPFRIEARPELVLGKRILMREGTLQDGDFLGVASGGLVSAGREQLDVQLSDLIRRRPGSARYVVHETINRFRASCDGQPANDATFAGVYFRPHRSLMVFTGPPLNRDEDDARARQLLAFQGAKVVCGGTTGGIVASYLGCAVKTERSTELSSLPPIGVLPEVDLVTEGILTMAAALDCMKNAGGDLWRLPGERNGAVLLATELLRADSIHFLLGQAINPHYQNPLLPRSISIRRNLVEQIAEFLRGLNKEVEIEYC
jgi:hypothetical protein